MDSNTLKALRVVVNESTTKQIKELQKDSDELKKIKEELPILALSDNDINNHQTGHYLEKINHLNYQSYLFQGKISHGIYKWFLDDGTEEHLNLEEMMDRGFCHCPCPRYGCDGKRNMCPFEEIKFGCHVCGLYYLAEGFHRWDELSLWAEAPTHLGFDLIWKKEPTNLSRGQLKEVQCKCCGKVLPEADIIDHIYDYQHPIWKCPHEKV